MQPWIQLSGYMFVFTLALNKAPPIPSELGWGGLDKGKEQLQFCKMHATCGEETH